MAMPGDNRSIPELFTDALNQFTTLVRKEIQLARTEVSTKLSQAAVGIAMMAGSAVVMIAALVLLLIALATWLVALGVSEPVADLIAGVLGVLISAGLAWAGLKRLKAENLTPERTIEQLQRDAAVAKEQVK